jgi:hypothetical protein
MILSQVQPTWAEGGTVMNVALPVPLAAGLPMKVIFQGYRDQNGIEQTSPTSWSIRVAGSADYFPVVNGDRSEFDLHTDRGEIGQTDPYESSDEVLTYGIAVQQDGRFFVQEFHQGDPEQATNWEIMRKTGSALQWLGTHEELEGGGSQEIHFADAMPLLLFPTQAGTTVLHTTAQVPDVGLVEATWTLHIIGQEDLERPHDDPATVYWTECWKVETNLVATVDGDLFHTEDQIRWYSPTIGMVREIVESEDTPEQRWTRREANLRLPE